MCILCICFVETTSFWSMAIISTCKQKRTSKSKYSQKLENGNTGIPRMLGGSRHLHQVWWSELDPGNHAEKREPTAISCFLTSTNIFLVVFLVNFTNYYWFNFSTGSWSISLCPFLEYCVLSVPYFFSSGSKFIITWLGVFCGEKNLPNVLMTCTCCKL